MKAALLAWLSGRITVDEMHRYRDLHTELMRNDFFAKANNDDPKWKELEELIKKIIG